MGLPLPAEVVRVNLSQNKNGNDEKREVCYDVKDSCEGADLTSDTLPFIFWKRPWWLS